MVGPTNQRFGGPRGHPARVKNIKTVICILLRLRIIDLYTDSSDSDSDIEFASGNKRQSFWAVPDGDVIRILPTGCWVDVSKHWRV